MYSNNDNYQEANQPSGRLIVIILCCLYDANLKPCHGVILTYYSPKCHLYKMLPVILNEMLFLKVLFHRKLLDSVKRLYKNR